VSKTYQVLLSQSAEKGLRRIRESLPAIGRKIVQMIDRLKTEPHLGMKLKGTKDEIRRIRVGDYRIIYEVHESTITIIVLYIGPRGGAY